MFKISTAALLAATILAAPANANLLVNGGFETGDFSGWTQSGDTSGTGVSTLLAPEGDYLAFFSTTGINSFLSQTVATTVGDTYSLSFKLATQGGPLSLFAVTLDGVLLDSALNAGFHGFEDHSYSHVATGSSMVLQFTFRQDSTFYLLDAVSLDGPAPVDVDVPEPAMLGLFGLGALGLAAARRRKAA